jgi:hypothetical protein
VLPTSTRQVLQDPLLLSSSDLLLNASSMQHLQHWLLNRLQHLQHRLLKRLQRCPNGNARHFVANPSAERTNATS